MNREELKNMGVNEIDDVADFLAYNTEILDLDEVNGMYLSTNLIYVKQVLHHEINVGKKIELAIKRFVSDLNRSINEKDYPFYFDGHQADAAIEFIELLPKTDGSKLELQPFQKWIIGELYGWREKSTGDRRYDRAFISMARKCGKTYLASCFAALGLIKEKIPARNRQVLFVANSAKQARLGYNMLSSEFEQVRKQSPYVRTRVKVRRNKITDNLTGSTCQALSANTNTLEGYGASTGILDEFDQAKTRATYTALQTGQTNVPNSLLMIISTSGVNINCPMHDEYEMLIDVLTGKTKAARYFIAIWELDKREEVFDPNNWIKANPLLCEPTVNKRMTTKLKSDLDLAVKQNNLIPFLSKSMNMWVQASDDSYISADDWSKGKLKKIPDLNNRDVFIGIDFSKSNDLTAVSWLVPIGNGQFYCDSHSWVGTKYGLSSKIKRDGIDYRSMERAGECSITRLDSGIIDYDEVFEYIQELVGKYNWNVKAIAYDPYNFTALLTKFEKANYPLFEVRQGAITLNIPTRDFRDKLYDGKIKHNGNKILAYAVNNAILKVVNNGWQLDKARNSNRIDPIAALIDSYVAGKDYYQESEDISHANSYYESDDFSF